MPFGRRGLVVVLVACAWSAAGCRATPLAGARPSALSPAGAHPGEVKVRTELYFGLSKGGDKEVSADEWAAFLAEEVTPLFPRGFTVVDASGQWKNGAGGLVRERSKILILLHDDDPVSAGKVDAIRTVYKRRFGQESVIRSNQVAQVDFFGP